MKITENQVFVTDLKKAENFYSDVLRFPLKSKTADWLLYEPGLEFVVMAGALEQKPHAAYGKRADSVVCLEVSNIESVVDDLKKKKTKILSEVQSVQQGKFASFCDPDGNLFELIERKPSVQIIPYRPEWTEQFQLLHNKLSECIKGLFVSIDHIGSTSVPGLGSKDRIDAQITVKAINESFKFDLDKALNSGGFGPSKWNEDHRPPGDVNPAQEWKKLYLSGTHPELGFRSNIHIRVESFANQIYPILFRDYLRQHLQSAMAYQKAKEELARYHGNSSIAYSELKDPICDLIMVDARRWAEENRWKPGAYNE